MEEHTQKAVTVGIDVGDRYCHVCVVDAAGEERTYTIVGIDETRIEEGRISWTSPLARALLDGREGDLVKARTPAGEEALEILEVSYPI